MAGLPSVFTGPSLDIAASIARDYPGSEAQLIALGQSLRDVAVPAPPLPSPIVPAAPPPTPVPAQGAGFIVIKQQQFLAPRGKFDIEFSETKMRVFGKDVALEVSTNFSENLFILFLFFLFSMV